MSVRGYQIAVLWSRAGDYTGTLEDVSSYVLDSPDVVAQWGRQEPRATEEAMTGTLTFALTNIDRQFSPENSTSPIAGDVLTGTPTRFQVVDPTGGAVTTVFQGPIDELDTDPNAAAKDFTAKCSDGWGKPSDTKLSTTVYQGQRTGDLVGVVLDAIGWPAAARSIDSGVTTVPYWWLEDVDAQTAINDLVQSEGPPAVAWVQNGTFYFRDRHHRVTRAPSLTSQGTHTHTIPAGAVVGDHKILAGSFRYQHGLGHIINSATLEVTPRFPAAQQVVWTTPDPIVLDASEVRAVFIRTDDPFLDLQLPSASFTYLDDGQFRQDYNLVSGSVSFALSRTTGQSAILTITAGVGGAFIDTGLSVRGRPLKQAPARKFTASDPSSQTTYGLNDWDATAPWAYYYDAQAIVDRAVGIYSQPRPSVMFDIDGVLSSATLTRILATQLSDRVTVRNDELGLNADFMVEQITHTVQQLGVRHVLTVGAQVVEPYQAQQQFIFDTASPTVNGFGNGRFGMDVGYNPTTMFRFDTASPTTQGFGNGVFVS